MKSLTSKEALENAKRWLTLKKKIAQLDEELDYIKDYFKGKVEEGEAIQVGKYVIGCTLCSRSSLKKDLLIKDHGPEFVEKYSFELQYVKLDIKVAG